MLSTVEVTGKRAGDATFLGQPKGLFYLAFTEAWERFSFYGMTALVVLYMVNQLLLPGHVEHIGGFSGFRAALESIVGPLSTQALASQIFGLYSGFVYFTPLLGGMIADRWIGQRNAVVIGALSMSGGHIAMTFDQSFLLALLLLVVGSGFLKGNISAQVGALYPPEDEARRTRGFVIFSTGINIGAVIGPLLCGLLAQLYGWHYGFGIAAIFMLLGLATYLYGYRYLPARVERRKFEGARLTAAERGIVYALVVVMIITIFQSTSYYQLYNVNPIWIQQHVRAEVGTFRILGGLKDKGRGTGTARADRQIGPHGYALGVRLCDPVALVQDVRWKAPAGKHAHPDAWARGCERFLALESGEDGLARIFLRPDAGEAG